MNTNHATLASRRAVQAVAVLLGMLGLVLIFFSLKVVWGAVVDHDLMGLIVVPLFFIPGGIIIAVAYRVVFQYSESAIWGLATLIGYAVFAILSTYTSKHMRVMWDDALNGKDMATQFVWSALPLATAWLSYRIVKWFLLRFALKKTSP